VGTRLHYILGSRSDARDSLDDRCNTRHYHDDETRCGAIPLGPGEPGFRIRLHVHFALEVEAT
jgi:hypothetical protein